MNEPPPSLKPPFAVRFSDQVGGRYGYKDGHVEIDIVLPFPISAVKKSVSRSFDFDQAMKLKEGVDAAVKWESVSPDRRPKLSEPFNVELGGPVSARYGYADAHVELVVQLPSPISLKWPEYVHSFPPDEVRQLKDALEKVEAWGRLSAEDRQRIGA